VATAYELLTPQARRELAAAAKVDPKTLRRCYVTPARTQPISRERVRFAAATLGFPAPPEPDSSSQARGGK
jgi:hypothetical protein